MFIIVKQNFRNAVCKETEISYNTFETFLIFFLGN